MWEGRDGLHAIRALGGLEPSETARREVGISRLLALFAVLGEPVEGFSEGTFRFVRLEGWETPSFSPLVFTGDRLETAHLTELQEFFARHPIRNPAIKSTPYFTFPGDGRAGQIRRQCDAAGWAVEEEPLCVNLFARPVSGVGRDGYRVSKHSLKAGAVPGEYRELLRENFDADDRYLDYAGRALCSVPSTTVLIHLADGQLAAGGTVSVRRGLGFLTWGSVRSAVRRKGIHQLLLQECTQLAWDQGAHACAYATRNRWIRNRRDVGTELFISRRPAA